LPPLPARLFHPFNHRNSPVLHACAWAFSSEFPLPLATIPLFSYSCALFCIAGIAIFHTFNAFRTLCAKHPGCGHHSPVANPKVRRTSASPRPPREKNLHFLSRLGTHHPPLATKSFTIRTSEKLARNPFRIRTYKTQDLKPFRMNTYEKTRGGRGQPNPPGSNDATPSDRGAHIWQRRPQSGSRCHSCTGSMSLAFASFCRAGSYAL